MSAMEREIPMNASNLKKAEFEISLISCSERNDLNIPRKSGSIGLFNAIYASRVRVRVSLGLGLGLGLGFL